MQEIKNEFEHKDMTEILEEMKENLSETAEALCEIVRLVDKYYKDNHEKNQPEDRLLDDVRYMALLGLKDGGYTHIEHFTGDRKEKLWEIDVEKRLKEYEYKDDSDE